MLFPNRKLMRMLMHLQFSMLHTSQLAQLLMTLHTKHCRLRAGLFGLRSLLLSYLGAVSLD